MSYKVIPSNPPVSHRRRTGQPGFRFVSPSLLLSLLLGTHSSFTHTHTHTHYLSLLSGEVTMSILALPTAFYNKAVCPPSLLRRCGSVPLGSVAAASVRVAAAATSSSPPFALRNNSRSSSSISPARRPGQSAFHRRRAYTTMAANGSNPQHDGFRLSEFSRLFHKNKIDFDEIREDYFELTKMHREPYHLVSPREKEGKFSFIFPSSDPRVQVQKEICWYGE